LWQEISAALLPWQQCFSTVSADIDRRVREGVFVALKALVGKAKRSLPKVLKPMMLPWLKALFDPENVVRAAAKTSFIAAFPPNKIADAFIYCRQEILDGFEEILKYTVQTLCDPKLYTKEEADEMYDRTVSSALLALAYVLESISPGQASNYFDGHEGIWNLSSFWKLSSHTSVLIRAGFYTLIRACCIHAPNYLHDDSNPNESKLKVATSAVLGAFGDKDCAGHQQMWECILVYMKTFPTSWNLVNLPKAVLPRLWSFVRHAAYGSVEISHPCLVPFIDLYAQASGEIDLHTAMLENLWASLNINAPRDSKQKECIFDTYLECLKHGLILMVRNDKLDDAKQLMKHNVGLCLHSMFSPEECCIARNGMTSKVVKALEFIAVQKTLTILSSDLRFLVLNTILESASLNSPRPDQVPYVTDFVCTFSRDSGSTPLFLSIAAHLCWNAVSACRDADAPKLLVLLKLLAADVSWWGPRLLDQESLHLEDRRLHQCSAETFCVEQLFQIISSTLQSHSGTDVLSEESLDILSAAFIIAINIMNSEELRRSIWPRLLDCMMGHQEPVQSDCVSLQALAVLLETAIRESGAATSGAAISWCCPRLDTLVLHCLRALCFRAHASPAPGLLESARRAAVVLHSLPPAPRGPWGEAQKHGQCALLSEAGLDQLAQLLVQYLQAAAGKRAAAGDERDSEINEGAGAAALDVAERLISGLMSTVGEAPEAPGATTGAVPASAQVPAQAPTGAVGRLGSLVDGVFSLVGHSDGAGKQLRYSHTAAEGSRLRSRLGCGASQVWSRCGRAAQVRVVSPAL
jgi:hypothetical protein